MGEWVRGWGEWWGCVRGLEYRVAALCWRQSTGLVCCCGCCGLSGSARQVWSAGQNWGAVLSVVTPAFQPPSPSGCSDGELFQILQANGWGLDQSWQPPLFLSVVVIPWCSLVSGCHSAAGPAQPLKLPVCQVASPSRLFLNVALSG